MDWIFPAYNYSEKKQVNFRIPNIFTGIYKNAFEDFINYYSPDVIAPYANRYPTLEPRSSRKCRFCKKTNPEVSFKKDAHIIPQFMGNKYLISDFECDSCNLKFSTYETSFADSIGLLRTTDGLRGQKGIPKFKKNGLNVYSKKDESGKDVVYLESSNPTSTYFNKETKTITIQTVKNPYVPIHIMKVLYKIGYSLLPTNELDNYIHISKIINTSELDNKLQEYCKVLVFTFPYFQNKPFAITFKKRPEFHDTNIPSKIVLLYFGRFMYEFVLLNSSDTFMIKKGGVGKIIYSPPYWDLKNGQPTQKILDFSGTEKIKEPESLLFTFDSDFKIE